MKILAIRDRMLNYYQRPMVFDHTPDLLAAVARNINDDKETKNEITQAPDHFEVWQLGEVDDYGDLKTDKQLICNCSSLIRSGVWKRRTEDEASTEGATPQRAPSAPGRPTQPTNGNGASSVQNPLRTAPKPPKKPRARSGGSDRRAGLIKTTTAYGK